MLPVDSIRVTSWYPIGCVNNRGGLGRGYFHLPSGGLVPQAASLCESQRLNAVSPVHQEGMVDTWHTASVDRTSEPLLIADR